MEGVPEPVKQLLECLEVLMEDCDHLTELEEWFALPEVERHTTPPPTAPSDDVVRTAEWQTVELVMQLLSDHMELVDLFQAAAEEARQVEEVGKIIRPQLYVPGQ